MVTTAHKGLRNKEINIQFYVGISAFPWWSLHNFYVITRGINQHIMLNSLLAQMNVNTRNWLSVPGLLASNSSSRQMGHKSFCPISLEGTDSVTWALFFFTRYGQTWDPWITSFSSWGTSPICNTKSIGGVQATLGLQASLHKQTAIKHWKVKLSLYSTY
jgi:hypothetical protein